MYVGGTQVKWGRGWGDIGGSVSDVFLVDHQFSYGKLFWISES